MRPTARTALLLASVGLLPGVALASSSGDSLYCRKVKARAGGDVALLFAPSLQLSVMKFPQSGLIDTTTVGAPGGYQLRAGLSFSAIDLYKAFRVMRLADADCREHDAEEGAQQLLVQADDVGRLAALERQAAFLEGQRPAWNRIAAESEKRASEHLITLVEEREIASRRAQLERRVLQIASDLSRLRAHGLSAPSATPDTLAAEVERAADGFERESSHLKTLDAWSLTVAGGVVPPAGDPGSPRPVDTFGMVQLSVNVGAPMRYTQEARYLDARAAEVRSARYEVPDQMRRLQARIQDARALALRELGIIDGELSSLRAARESLELAQARGAPQALAVVLLDLINLEADRVYLGALVDELDRVAGGGPQRKDS